MVLKRYWLQFDVSLDDNPPPGVLIGCGVTAHHYDDAMDLVRAHVFKTEPMPEIKNVKENIDISLLDEKHVLPNMGNPAKRGVWYPLGYD